MFKETSKYDILLKKMVRVVSQGNVSVAYTDKAMRDDAILTLNSKLKELT